MSRPKVADQLAEQFAAIADDLHRVGISPGVIAFAMATALAMVLKVRGGRDLASTKALICETIDHAWAADDEAQAQLKQLKGTN